MMIERMTAIWRELLAREDIDADSDFFVLGGDSLAATVLMVYVEEAFGVVFDPVEIFETPALSVFAEKVSQAAMATGSAATAELVRI